MRGKKAKQLQRIATSVLLKQGIDPNEDRNTYNQAMNCIEMGYFLNQEGRIAKDPDGDWLLKPNQKPGTVLHAHKGTIAYRRLKKLYKEGKRHGNTRS